MPSPRNVITRAGRWRAEVEGLKKLQTSFTELASMLRADGNRTTARRGLDIVKQGFASASIMMRDAVRSSLGGRSKRVHAATFAFFDLEKGRTPMQKRSALVGVRTGAPSRGRAADYSLYKVWGKGSTRKDGSIASNGLGISLGRIFQSGTSKQKKTRFFTNAVYSKKSRALQILTDAYKQAIALLNNG